jgi:flagellar biosynthetic protein FlhB
MVADNDDKTEEPTSKKLSDAREKGDVPNSKDTSGLIGLVVSLSVIYLSFDFMVDHIKKAFMYYLQFYGQELNQDMMMEIFLVTLKELGLIILPISLAIMVAGVLGTVGQIGFLFTTEAIKFKPEKLNPINGIKNLFSVDKLVEGTKMTVKSFVILGITYWYFLDFLEELPTVVMIDYYSQLEWLIETLMFLVLIILIIMLIFAAIDYTWTNYSYKKKHRMSKQDIKDEHKNMEGNPEIKGKIRQKQMEMVKQRMMSDVPKADVVVTNPTHYAVAIRYQEGTDMAPIVLAKGTDKVALKIKDIARENNVPIVENKPLARDLFKNVEIEQAVPERLWQAVAEVLAYVRSTNQM